MIFAGPAIIALIRETKDTSESKFNLLDGYVVPYRATSFLREDLLVAAGTLAFQFLLSRFVFHGSFTFLRSIYIKECLAILPCMAFDVWRKKVQYEINPISVKQLWDSEQEQIKKQQSRLCTLLLIFIQR